MEPLIILINVGWTGTLVQLKFLLHQMTHWDMADTINGVGLQMVMSIRIVN